MRYVRTVVKTLDCANFCAHPPDRWAHLRTASHMRRSGLSCFVSVGTLKTGRLFSVVRLPWAQEVWSSNLHAPTILLSQLQTERFEHQVLAQNWHCGCLWLSGCVG